MMSRFIETIKNNTTGAGELVRQGFMVMMALGWVTLTETQFLTVMSFFSAVIAYIGFKTTIATNKVDQRVDERVAHRELAGTTGTGDGMTPAKPPTTIIRAVKGKGHA